jgi:hypothetical protein
MIDWLEFNDNFSSNSATMRINTGQMEGSYYQVYSDDDETDCFYIPLPNTDHL